jgi:hypothetical protein
VVTGLTSVNYSMHIVQIRQALKNRQSNYADDLDLDWSDLPVDAVERPLVHVFHANADVGLCNESAV